MDMMDQPDNERNRWTADDDVALDAWASFEAHVADALAVTR